jgi:hypothetical protein
MGLVLHSVICAGLFCTAPRLVHSLCCPRAHNLQRITELIDPHLLAFEVVRVVCKREPKALNQEGDIRCTQNKIRHGRSASMCAR